MKSTENSTADLSKISYTEFFALRFGTDGSASAPEPCHARQACFASENRHPHQKNMLYVHVPFCVSRCRYCPYYSNPYAPRLLDDYLNALAKEVTMVAETPYVRSTRFECVYIGGGTPSLLKPDDLERLCVMLHSNFNLTADAEITLEANPFTLTEDKIQLLRPLGINRVSLGVQSFDDATLRNMRCAHSAAQAKRAIHSVLEQDVVLNVDLLFGLAGQTEAGLEIDLEQLCSGRLPHQVTMFPLRIARGTPLAGELEQQGTLEVMGYNSRLLEFDTLVEKRLRDHSFMREEAPIMYFGKDAHPHRYHSVEGRIVGLGAGAGSVLDGAESVNQRNVTRYIADLLDDKLPVAHDAHVTGEQARERFVLFRILFMNRSLPGFKEIVKKRFEEYFDQPIGAYLEKVVHDMKSQGYVNLVDGKVIFTERLWRVLAGLPIGTPSIL